MGSRTFGGTLLTQCATLRTSSPVVLSSALVVLWLLSPLGGQASLNLLSVGNKGLFNSTKVRYLDTEHQRSFVTSISSPTYIYDALYASSLLSSQNLPDAPMDTWGNIKV